jgi:circadian clock protein KaiC
MSDESPNDEPRLERAPSGIAGLDTILHGGFLKGGIYILQGEPGAGKTIAGNQLCYTHVVAGGKALYVTLLAESHARMLMHIGALSFFDPAVLPERLYYISVYRVLEEEGVQGLIEVLRREVLSQGTTMLVIDGLVTVQEGASSDLELKKFVHQLQTTAILADCTMFLLTSAPADLISPEHTMVDGIIQLTNETQGGWRAERRLEVRKFRGSPHLLGKHAYSITDQGLSVFPRIEGLQTQSTPEPAAPETPKATTGIARLDVMLGGGLDGGSTSLLVGPSGIGKTTLGLHMLNGCGPREPGLLFSFHERPDRIMAKAEALSLGLPDLVRRGTVDLIWQPATEGVIDELVDRLLQNVRRRGVRRVVIDGLAGLEQATAEPGRIHTVCTALANQLRNLGVTTLYTAEIEALMGPVPSMPLSGVILRGSSSTAENILLMRYVELRARMHRLIAVLKTRDSPSDGAQHEFAITDKGIAIDETPARAEALLAELAGGRAPEGGPA